jgi:hypothetical protein
MGAGRGATTIRGTFVGGDIIRVGDGVANPNNCRISDLSIDSTVAKTSGAAIRFRNGHNLGASRIRMDGNLFWGFQFDGGAQQFLYFLNDFEINSPNVGIIMGEDGTLPQDVWVRDGIIAGATSDGILLRHVSGYYIDAVDILGCARGLTTFPDTGKMVAAGICNRIICDTCDENGFHLLTNGGGVFDSTFNNCWASSNGVSNLGVTQNNGIYFSGGSGSINGISFNGGRVTNNKGAGVKNNDGSTNIHFNGMQVFSNSTVGSGQRSGYEIGAGVSDWSIIGGKSGAGGLFGGGNNQRYGIEVAAGSSDRYVVQGVNLMGNVTGPMLDGATGTVRSVAGNPGYVNARRGSVTLPNGASSVVVNHGLNATPIQTDIIVLPLVDINTGGVARWWVSAATATTFTLSVNAAATADLFFTWDAKAGGA